MNNAVLPTRALIDRPRHNAFMRAVGWFVIKHYGLCAFLVRILMVFNVFWRLPGTVISDSDEARYGVAASEMLHAHSWLVPTYAGQAEYWNLKPPLGYWFMELSYAIFGSSVWALRIPSALCAIGVVALTMHLGKRWGNRRIAVVAGLICATSWGFIVNHGARSGDLDAALTLILLGVLAQIPRLARSSSAIMLAGTWLAAGFLLKSFAILPAILVLMAFLSATGEWRKISYHQWMLACALFLGVVFAWAVARTWADGSDHFVRQMLREDLFLRATRDIDAGHSSRWSYVGSLLDRMAPWPLVLAVIVAVGGWRCLRLPRQMAVLLCAWMIVPFVGFSLARTHHHWYLDPYYPALAILAAAAILAALRWAAPRLNGAVLLCMLCIIVLACETRVILSIGMRSRMPPSQVFLQSLSRLHTPHARSLCANFTLSHSERFILQVIDGFKVIDGVPRDAPECKGALRLTHRRSMMSHADRRARQLLAESEDYALLSSPAVENPDEDSNS